MLNTKYQRIAASKLIIILMGILLIAMGILQIGCSKKSTEPDDQEYPAQDLSFTQHIYPILLQNCITSGCHGTDNPQNGLDLETPAPNFLNANNQLVVFPNDAQNSKLYRLLESDYLGIARMPYLRSQISQNKRTAIKTWIDEGALITN